MYSRVSAVHEGIIRIYSIKSWRFSVSWNDLNSSNFFISPNYSYYLPTWNVVKLFTDCHKMVVLLEEMEKSKLQFESIIYQKFVNLLNAKKEFPHKQRTAAAEKKGEKFKIKKLIGTISLIEIFFRWFWVRRTWCTSYPECWSGNYFWCWNRQWWSYWWIFHSWLSTLFFNRSHYSVRKISKEY